MSDPQPHSPSSLDPVEEQASEEKESGAQEEEVVEEEEVEDKRERARRKKLADGFYEVEAIRKKRICKGEAQYLIKWHGWPESANTWEPISNLHTCHDVVEAYEESLCSGQKKSSRKRKRIFTREKKKMQHSYGLTTTNRTTVKRTVVNEAHDTTALNENSNLQAGTVEAKVDLTERIKRSRAPKRVDSHDTETVGLHAESNDKNDGPEFSGKNANGGTLDVNFQKLMPVEGDSPTNCQSKVNCEEDGQSNQCRGAKRRKSGSVRRFTLETTALDRVDSGNTVLQSSCDRVEQLGKPVIHCKKKIDSPRNSAVITRLIKPVSYSTSVTNNTQDVTVTFAAVRSDGQEVMVDNKFLRANNPHLLIEFYEQHLRYNPN